MVSSNIRPKDSYSRTEAAALLGVSTARVTQLANEKRLFKVSDDNADYWAEGKKLVLVEGKRQKGLPKGADEERVTLKPRGSAFPPSKGEAPALSADGKEPETFHNNTVTSASAPASTGVDGAPDEPPTEVDSEHTSRVTAAAAGTPPLPIRLLTGDRNHHATTPETLSEEWDALSKEREALSKEREGASAGHTPVKAPVTAHPAPDPSPESSAQEVTSAGSAEDRVALALSAWLESRVSNKPLG